MFAFIHLAYINSVIV